MAPTKIGMWGGMALLVVAFAVSAQRVDCPVRGGSMPRTPPGKPPFTDQIGELTQAEEGHLTAIARMVEYADATPPAPDVLLGLVDPGKTALSQWRFEGHVRGEPRHKVPRVFTKGGSVLVFEQWNMAADGASVVSSAGPSVMLGQLPAWRGGLRSPSGCVSASLTWHDAGVKYSLTVAGPLSLSGQRDLLVSIARSIVDAAPSSGR